MVPISVIPGSPASHMWSCFPQRAEQQNSTGLLEQSSQVAKYVSIHLLRVHSSLVPRTGYHHIKTKYDLGFLFHPDPHINFIYWLLFFPSVSPSVCQMHNWHAASAKIKSPKVTPSSVLSISKHQRGIIFTESKKTKLKQNHCCLRGKAREVKTHLNTYSFWTPDFHYFAGSFQPAGSAVFPCLTQL